MHATPRRLRAAALATATAAVLAGCAGGGGGTLTPAASDPAGPPAGITGTLFYLGESADFKTQTLYTLRGTEAAALGDFTGAETYAFANLNVAPDGAMYSYVTTGGELMVAPVGGEPSAIAENADMYCVDPVWRPVPGGEPTLLYGELPSPTEAVVPRLVATPPRPGAGEDLGDAGTCHFRFAADGAVAVGGAPTIDGFRLRVIAPDGTGGARPTITAPGRQIVDLFSVGPGGRLVCVATVAPDGPTGDIGRSLGCDTVLNVDTGEVVDLPVEDVTAVDFGVDGTMLVRSADGTLTLLSAGLEVLDTMTEPAEFADRALLEYVPG